MRKAQPSELLRSDASAAHEGLTSQAQRPKHCREHKLLVSYTWYVHARTRVMYKLHGTLPAGMLCASSLRTVKHMRLTAGMHCPSLIL